MEYLYYLARFAAGYRLLQARASSSRNTSASVLLQCSRESSLRRETGEARSSRLASVVGSPTLCDFSSSSDHLASSIRQRTARQSRLIVHVFERFEALSGFRRYVTVFHLQHRDEAQKSEQRCVRKQHLVAYVSHQETRQYRRHHLRRH